MSKPTSNGNAKKKQRTTGPSSGLAPGGANLLDSLLGGMNRTMARLPTKPMSQAQRQAEQAEAGMHYGMYKPPPQKDGKADPNVCRNPDCGGREFEIDWRQGDRICQSCGAVQNSRSVENRDAEYRIFQDDEKSANKERASVISGRGGGSVGQANVAGAHALANKNAAKQEGENGLTDKDHKRITDYQEKVVSLGEHLNLTQNIIDQARLSLCEKLVIAQNIHEEGKRLLPRRSRGGLLTTAQRPPPHAVHCNAPADDRCFALRAAGREPGKDSSRLAQFKGQKSTALVAAALLKKSMRDHDVDRMFEELKNALIHSEGLGAEEAAKIGQCYQVVVDLLKPRGLTPPPLALTDGAAGSSSSAAGGTSGSPTEGTTQAASLVPRLTNHLNLQPFIQTRAQEIIADWAAVGMPSSAPPSIAAAAILRAHDEYKALLRKMPGYQELQPSDLARVTSYTEATIMKHVQMPDLPWPTALLRNAIGKLKSEGSKALTQQVQDGAVKKMEMWLGTIAWDDQGEKRKWCRETSPRALAACALVLASREAGGRPLLTAGMAAAAVDEVQGSATAVEAALAAMPGGAGSGALLLT